jgi:hypothetical protein
MSAILIVALLVAADPDPVRDFQARVDAYVRLHRTLEAGTPPRVITRDPAQILLASDMLADAIVAARPQARQGDIFTRDVARVFRERIQVALGGVDVDRYLDELYEGENFRNLRAAIHARDPYCRVPSGLPMALLWSLPGLPGELEYRIVGRDLALWDEHAALIIDFIPNAFPEQSFTRERSRSWPLTTFVARRARD